jgi:AraC family transcriptional regulator
MALPRDAYTSDMAVVNAGRTPVGKALWYIETHFGGEITLDDIAAAAGVSRFHLSRAFPIATGKVLADYVRSRRLTEAARALAAGAPNILCVALDAGYGSHEAFTRAFRERFGLTPEALRTRGNLNGITLTEALRMDTAPTAQLEPPRIERIDVLLITGIGARYSPETIAGIPAQWQRFGPHIGSIPGQVGFATYGVCTNGDGAGHFDYVCGVEVRDFDATPAEWNRVRIADQRFAVFTHREHLSALRATCDAIWNVWLPASEYEVANAPDFERYGETFDPRSGLGGLEIWIPIKG